MAHDDRVLEAAGALTDGTTVDWDRLSDSASPDNRAVVRNLEIVARIASTCHEFSSGAAVEPPVTWGPLRIIKPLGAGTYADVYLAHDPRVDRAVALKLLRHAESDATGGVAAVIEEARLLARVRHPSVVTIFGADLIDGRVGIWMDFIAGRTLAREVSEGGPLPAEDVTRIGRDLCGALGAVHRAGVIHRDVKAQNVLRDDHGHVWLTDFGTGREMAEVARASDLAGTPLYAAPEVLAGQPASPGSDVYSLGVLLYFLATGGFPVNGGSLPELRERHARGERTQVRAARPDVPSRLAAVIDRATSLDPAERFRSADAFESALAVRPRQRSETLGVIAAVAAGLVAAGAAAWLWIRSPLERSGQPPNSALADGLQRLTFTGDARLGTVSRDGKFVAYLRRFAGTRTVWVHWLATRTDVQVASIDGEKIVFAVTPTADGRSIDVVIGQPLPSDTDDLWRVPVAGGTFRKVVSDIWSAPGWSPDGRHFAFVRALNTTREFNTQLWAADPDGSNERLVSVSMPPERFLNTGLNEVPVPAWSPDGHGIAVLTLPKLGVLNRVSVRDVSTGQERMARDVDPSVNVVGVDWLDSSTVLIDRYAARGGARQIWKMNLKTGQSAPVTHDVADYRGLSTTADRRMAVSTRVDKLAGIWVGDSGGERMVATVPDTPRFPSSVSLDNQGDLAYDTATDVSSDIWIQRPGSDGAQLLYSHGQRPALTPDGVLIAFCDLTGTRHIAVIRSDGSQLAPLTNHGWQPSITPDGRTVVFTSNAADGSGISTLWAVPVAGGAARELTHRRSGTFSLSPDGRQLMFRSSDRAGGDVVVTCDMPECANERELHLSVFNGLQANCRFAPDSKSIGCLKLDHPSDVWLQPLDGGPRRQLTHFLDRDIADFVWSPDGKRLAVTRKLVQSDIVLLTGFR